MSYSGLKTLAEAGPSVLEATANTLKGLVGIGGKKAIDVGLCLKEMPATGWKTATGIAEAAIGSQVAARLGADLKNMGDELSNAAATGMKAVADGGEAIKSFAERCDEALDGKTIAGYELKPLVHVGVKVTAGAVITMGVVSVAMPAVGFTTAGVGANTLAAAWQGSIGNVAAGSLFASLQSAGVVGLGVTTKIGIVTAGGLGGVYLGEAFKNKKE